MSIEKFNIGKMVAMRQSSGADGGGSEQASGKKKSKDPQPDVAQTGKQIVQPEPVLEVIRR